LRQPGEGAPALPEDEARELESAVSYRSILKRLLSDRRFTGLSVLTLALGIGLTVSVFTLVYGVLLSPLPYPDPERLIDVSHEAPGLDLDDMDISIPLYLRYRDRVRAFEAIALLRDNSVSLTGLESPDRVRHARVTASLFDVVGVAPMRGRAFDADDEKPGAPGVVLVSERFWRGRLGGDPGVLERSLELDGAARSIVGVLPSRFGIPDEDIDVWTPFAIDESQRLGQFSYRCLARLREAVTLDAARREVGAIASALESEFPEESAAPVLARSAFAPVLTPLLDQIVGDVRSAFLVLAGAVGFVLLMASVNVANVFLVRAEARRSELALRSALGAGRRQILAEFFAEGLFIALAAGTLAVGLAELAVRALVRFAPEGVPRLSEIAIDSRSLAFALLVSIVAAVLFALLPTLPYSRPDVVTALREVGRGRTAAKARVSLRKALVAMQLGLGLVLLVGAGLMIRSFYELHGVDPGFRAEDALTFRVSLPRGSYDSSERVVGFVERATERLRALPGVHAVGAADNLPLTGSASGAGHEIEDFPLGDADLPPVFMTHAADPGYREAMGIPLREGRWLEPFDHREGRRVVVVNETIARRYWPQGSAVGRRIVPGRAATDDEWYEIVGVVGDVRHEGLAVEPRGETYYPLRDPEGNDSLGGSVSFVIRGGGSFDSLSAAARSAVWEIDPNVPITQVSTLEQLLVEDRAATAFSMSLLLLASVLAVVLGAVGTYGVVSFVVSQRTQEIGVRMALGAVRGQVRGMVLRDGLRTALPGIAIGVAAAFATTRLMTSLLFGVSPLDPLSFVLAPVFLLLIALGSTLLPAERASRVNPIEALRSE
jgi:predicted permease